MEQTLVHLAHAALWFFIIVFILAFIGVVAIIRWIMNAVRRTETAVSTGVQNVEERFRH